MYATLTKNITNGKTYMQNNSNSYNENNVNDDSDCFVRNNIAIQIDRVKTKNKSIQAPNDLGLYP